MKAYDVVIIGAGLTGLSCATFLKKRGFENILILEKASRIGGAICSHSENGFIFEEGPNTGVIGNPEIVELLEILGLEAEVANEKSEKRLILKNNQWHPLPGGAGSFLKTPLFTLMDKVKIAFEPFRKKGNDPYESVASLARRRIGQSFVDYAVNPFISGIYAGDPERLVTKYALPKLYNLEQDYGSFIKGAIQKSKEPKSEREKKATRKVFSEKSGFGGLTEGMKNFIGDEAIICNACNVEIKPEETKKYSVSYENKGTKYDVCSSHVITTIGGFELPEVLPFIATENMKNISDINYAKVIQVAVGVERSAINDCYISFGGLIPQKENKRLLGVLFPSFCFDGRAPQGYATLAIYMGGAKHPEFIKLSDEEIENIVREELLQLFQISEKGICFMKIFRHEHAIPQYEKSSGKRFETIKDIESQYPGLIIGGNLRDGIGIADRVKQAYHIAQNIS